MIKVKLLVIVFGLAYSSYFGNILFSALNEIQTQRISEIQNAYNY